MRRVRQAPTPSGAPPSFPKIGRWFNRDHATVIWGVRKAEERRKFLELPPAEAQRLIDVRSSGIPLDAGEEDPIFSSDPTCDGVLD